MSFFIFEHTTNQLKTVLLTDLHDGHRMVSQPVGLVSVVTVHQRPDGRQQHHDGVGAQGDAGGRQARGAGRAPRRAPHALQRQRALAARRARRLPQGQPEQEVVQLGDLQVGWYQPGKEC